MDIIDHRRKTSIITFIGWFTMSYGFYYLILNITLLLKFINYTAAFTVTLTIFMIIWKKYDNIKKVKRQIIKTNINKDVTNNEMAKYFNICLCIVQDMQNRKVINLNNTIV